MDRRIVFKILAGLVLIAAVTGIAYLAFNAGVAQAAVAKLPAPAGQSGNAPFWYYGRPFFWHPFGLFGLGCFGPLLVLLLLFMALPAMRFVLWGPGWTHGGSMHRGWRHAWNEEGGIPPMFREWHDRAHGKPGNENEGQQRDV